MFRFEISNTFPCTRPTLWIALAGAIALAAAASASERKAHQHGVGELNLAVEGKAVEIELAAPGADIVGFEHEARTDAQKRAVSKAAKALRDGAALFVFPAAANCVLHEAEVESPLLEDRHGHKDHDHKHGDGDEHAEFDAHYHFECAAPDRLTHIDTTYFKAFPNAQALSARVLTETGQRAQRLTPAAARLKF